MWHPVSRWFQKYVVARHLDINVRENRRVNQEWTIQKHWQHSAHNTQGEDNQNAKKKKNTENKKLDHHGPFKNRRWNHVFPNDKLEWGWNITKVEREVDNWISEVITIEVELFQVEIQLFNHLEIKNLYKFVEIRNIMNLIGCIQAPICKFHRITFWCYPDLSNILE